MAIQHRAAQNLRNQGTIPLTIIEPMDTSMLPEIENTAPPATAAAPSNIQSPVAAETFAAPTANSGPGLLTETAPLSSSTSTRIPLSTPSPTPVTVSVTSSATPSQTPAASPGISPGRLTAAIVVPIAVLAILIPIITYWILNHKRKLQEQRYASQRNSHSREPMIQKQPSYGAPPFSQLQKHSPYDNIQAPPSAQTRNSLGLFNFELSPNTPTSPPGSRESETNPRFRFSIARALEMRRSQPSIVQPHARTSDARVSRLDTGRPRTRGSNRNSRANMFDPPPPYASPRPSESVAARSHFAPLSRIGTQNLANRSPPRNNARMNDIPDPDRSTYASSEIIRSPDSYGHVHTRSTSPSLEWPSPPRTQGVVARKPVPAHSPRIASQAISPQNASHLDRPFSSYLPERLSDVSGFSIDTSRWEDGDRSRQESTISMESRIDGDETSSTIQPHHIV